MDKKEKDRSFPILSCYFCFFFLKKANNPADNVLAVAIIETIGFAPIRAEMVFPLSVVSMS